MRGRQGRGRIDALQNAWEGAMQIALVVAAVVLAGCASSSKTYSADGREAYVLNCSGVARNWGMCEEKAGELCGARGYDVKSMNTDRGQLTVTTQNLHTSQPTISRTMTVACR